MKKCIVTLLCIIFVASMCGCLKKDDVNTEQEEGEFITLNHLTGEEMDSALSGKRPFAIAVGNIYHSGSLGAWPQYGIASCDILIEAPIRDSITSLVALYNNVPDELIIGPIREIPDPFVEVTYSLDPIYVHSASTTPSWTSSFFNYNQCDTLELNAAPQFFYRNEERIAEGYPNENTKFTTGALLNQAVKELPYLSDVSDRDAGSFFTFEHPDRKVTLTGGQANRVQFTYASNDDYDGDFIYDSTVNKYLKYQRGEMQKDAEASALMFTNVLVMSTQIFQIDPVTGNVLDTPYEGGLLAPWYNISYGGTAYYFSNGMYEQVTWSKESDYTSYFSFTKADGTPLLFNAGNTMMCFVEMTNEITITV